MKIPAVFKLFFQEAIHANHGYSGNKANFDILSLEK